MAWDSWARWPSNSNSTIAWASSVALAVADTTAASTAPSGMINGGRAFIRQIFTKATTIPGAPSDRRAGLACGDGNLAALRRHA